MAVLTQQTTTPTASKVAATASVLFAITLFLTVAIVNIPRDATDAAVLDWWQQSSNRMAGLISGALAVVVAVLFAVVMNHIRALPAASAAPRWLAFARSMGTAFTATLLVSAAVRGVVGYMVETLDDPLPEIGVLRYSAALGYQLMNLPVMTVLALTIAAVSVVVLRTGVFGRWLAFVGLACAAIILIAVGAQLGAFSIPAALLWALCLAVAIWKQPAH
jgi:hypothetical protein